MHDKQSALVDSLFEMGWFEQYSRPGAAVEFYRSWMRERLETLIAEHGSAAVDALHIPSLWYDVECVNGEGKYAEFVNGLSAVVCGLLRIDAVEEKWSKDTVHVRINVDGNVSEANWTQEDDLLAPEFYDLLHDLISRHSDLSLAEYQTTSQDGRVFIARSDLLSQAIGESVLRGVRIVAGSEAEPAPERQPVQNGVFKIPLEVTDLDSEGSFRTTDDRPYYLPTDLPKPIKELWRTDIHPMGRDYTVAGNQLHLLNSFCPNKLHRINLADGSLHETECARAWSLMTVFDQAWLIESGFHRIHLVDDSSNSSPIDATSPPIGATTGLGARHVFFEDWRLDLDTGERVPIKSFEGKFAGKWFAGVSNRSHVTGNSEHDGILNLERGEWMERVVEDHFFCADLNDHCALYRSNDDQMLLVDLSDGRAVWQSECRGSDPRIIGNRIVASNMVYDLATGSHLHGKPSHKVTGRSVVSGSMLWYGRFGAKNQFFLHCVDLDSGNPIQKLAIDVNRLPNLVAVPGKLVVVGQEAVACFG